MDLSKCRRIMFILATSGLLTLVITILATQPSRVAGPWYVAPGGDDVNDCLSPASPCASINGTLTKPGFVISDTVLVATGIYTGTGDQVVLLDKSATLSGGWDETFTTQNGTSAIEGEETHRGITVDTGVTAVIDRFAVQQGYIDFGNGGGIHNSGILTMTNSMIDHNYCYHLGGGIYNQGTLTLNNCTISGNSADWVGDGGGIGNDGALTLNSSTVSDNNFGGIYNHSGTLTLDGSTISGNTGGGILCDGTVTLNNSTVSGNTGGGIRNGGTVTLTSSTVSANTGPGIGNDGTVTLNNSTVSRNTGGGMENTGTMTLNNSTVSRNTTSEVGGGILNRYDSTPPTLTLNSSTVSDNVARWSGGGISGSGTVALNNSTVSRNTAGWSGGGISASGTVALNNSTVSGNMAHDDGGGIYFGDTGAMTLNNSTVSGNMAHDHGGGIRHNSTGGGPITLQNTILAGNTASGSGPDFSCFLSDPTIGSAGYNLIGNTSGCAFVLATGDLVGINAQLRKLEGSPGYHPLLPGSPAINAGNPAGCTDHLGNPLAADQRGMPRDGRCDMGAYEFGFSADIEAAGTYAPGGTLTYSITLRSEVGTAFTGVMMTDTLPLFLTYVPGSFSATSGAGGESSGVVTWTGTVPALGSTTISFRATIAEDLPLCSTITNRVRIGAGAGYGFAREVAGLMPCVCDLTKHGDNPVLSVGAPGSWDAEDVRAPAVLKVGDLYKMWFTGSDGSSPSRIGLATSADGIIWTKEATNPVLMPSETWEETGISAGTVISDSGLYEMWYTGYDSNGVGRIGYATSSDGLTWDKVWQNPILDVGRAESWDDEAVSEPAVVKQGGIYHMWYTGDDGVTARIGHAISNDGIDWSQDPGNPVLDVGPPGEWDWLQVYAPTVLAHGDQFLLWYSGETLPSAWETGYSQSPDGSDWTRGRIVISEGGPGSFDANSADYASSIVDDSGFKIWYSGANGADVYSIGYASARFCYAPSGPFSDSVYLPVVLKSRVTQDPCSAFYSDGFDDPRSGWPSHTTSDYDFGYENGQYKITIKNPPDGLSLTPGAMIADFVGVVSARRTSDTYGAYGILFGINEDWSQFYEFNVDGEYYSLWKFENGNWTALRDWTPSGHIRTGTNWNRLKVVRKGESISIYVNNQHLATVTDGSFTGSRRVGLSAGSFLAFTAYFDDFALHPADCGPSVTAASAGFVMGKPEVHYGLMAPGLDKLP